MFFTQIASIIGFIVVLFVLYRVLISQKDATIELLKERITGLKEKLETARTCSPEILTKKLSERVRILTEELGCLSKDSEENHHLVQEKKKKLHITQSELEILKDKLEYAQEIASEFFCPYCNAPMETRVYSDESVEDEEGRSIDIDHEYISFACGLGFSDGKEVSPCKEERNNVSQ